MVAEEEQYSVIHLCTATSSFGASYSQMPIGSFSSIPIPLLTRVSSKASLMSVDNRKKYLSDLLTGQLLNISISFKKKMELPQFISAGHLNHGLR